MIPLMFFKLSRLASRMVRTLADTMKTSNLLLAFYAEKLV